MKIEHLRIDGFGKRAGLETGPEPLESLVVVLGPNEAGKSTMFTFLTTALYGFQPASREPIPRVYQVPLENWGIPCRFGSAPEKT